MTTDEFSTPSAQGDPWAHWADERAPAAETALQDAGGDTHHAAGTEHAVDAGEAEEAALEAWLDERQADRDQAEQAEQAEQAAARRAEDDEADRLLTAWEAKHTSPDIVQPLDEWLDDAAHDVPVKAADDDGDEL